MSPRHFAEQIDAGLCTTNVNADAADFGHQLHGTLVFIFSLQSGMLGQTCSHISTLATIKHPKRRECEDCVKIGSQWVHLRTCQECGGTRCCDDSPNKHATKHARASKHPVIASAEPGERWLYCYPDDTFTEY